MDAGLQEKLIGYVLRGVTAAATGTGLAQVTSSTWIGDRVYESFRDSLGVTFLPHPPLPAELYEAFGHSVLLSPGVRMDAVFLLMLSAPLLCVLGHVVYRANLEDEGGGRLRRLYRRFHFAITLGLAVVLVAAVVGASSAAVLLASSALVALGVGLYLVLYCGDLRQKRFAPRFVWLALAVLFFANLVALPQVHGQRFFDLQLVQVVQKAGGTDEPSYRYSLTRPRLASARYLLFDIDYDATGVAVGVELVDDLSGWRTLENQEINLRTLVRRTELPALRTEAEVDRAVDDVLGEIGATS